MTIAILGAGLAGLATAHRLISSGYRDVIVIEATDRAGGRIESRNTSSGSRVDLGAQWLHGAQDNPIYAWLKDLDLINKSEEEECEFEGKFRFSDGSDPPDGLVQKILESLLDTKYALYNKSQTMNPSKSTPSNIFRRSVMATMAKESATITDPQIVESIIRWFELYEAIDNSCYDLKNLSIRAYSEYTDFNEGAMMTLKGGWQGVVDKLIETIGINRILFNCPVKRVELRVDGRVLITHANGNLVCERAVVTFSLGVLRSLSANFFEPELNTMRRENFARMGFDSVCKIFLEFDKPILSDFRGLKLLWRERDDPAALKLPSWACHVTGFDLVSDADNLLLVWVGGYGAQLVEEASDHEIRVACLRMLGMFAPDVKPVQLLSVIRSNWLSNPYFKGAYSYESCNADKIDRQQLWQSVCDHRGLSRIVFAGEATAGRLYSTAHGAISSGWLEADRIIEDINRDQMTLSDTKYQNFK